MKELKDLVVGDDVMYHNKIMVVKEPRDGSHFDLSCHKEGLMYCLVDIDEIKPVELTPAILKANGWNQLNNAYGLYAFEHPNEDWFELILEPDGWKAYCLDVGISNFFNSVHELQHLLFGLGLNSEMEV